MSSAGDETRELVTIRAARGTDRKQCLESISSVCGRNAFCGYMYADEYVVREPPSVQARLRMLPWVISVEPYESRVREAQCII